MRNRSFWSQILFHARANFALQCLGEFVANLVALHLVPGSRSEPTCASLRSFALTDVVVQVVLVGPTLNVKLLGPSLLGEVAYCDVVDLCNVVRLDLREEGRGLLSRS